jgi:hypothetical protein
MFRSSQISGRVLLAQSEQSDVLSAVATERGFNSNYWILETTINRTPFLTLQPGAAPTSAVVTPTYRYYHVSQLVGTEGGVFTAAVAQALKTQGGGPHRIVGAWKAAEPRVVHALTGAAAAMGYDTRLWVMASRLATFGLRPHPGATPVSVCADVTPRNYFNVCQLRHGEALFAAAPVVCDRMGICHIAVGAVREHLLDDVVKQSRSGPPLYISKHGLDAARGYYFAPDALAIKSDRDVVVVPTDAAALVNGVADSFQANAAYIHIQDLENVEDGVKFTQIIER